MTQIELIQERKRMGAEYKAKRLALMCSARQIIEAAFPLKITHPTIYKFEKGGSCSGDTRTIYDYTLKLLEK